MRAFARWAATIMWSGNAGAKGTAAIAAANPADRRSASNNDVLIPHPAPDPLTYLENVAHSVPVLCFCTL